MSNRRSEAMNERLQASVAAEAAYNECKQAYHDASHAPPNASNENLWERVLRLLAADDAYEKTKAQSKAAEARWQHETQSRSNDDARSAD